MTANQSNLVSPERVERLAGGAMGKGSTIPVQVSPKFNAQLLGSPKTRENLAEGEF